jgi:hypothetical protein
MPNRVNFLLFSNDPRPMHLDTDDRRYMVYESPAKQNPDLANRFYAWMMGDLVELDSFGTKGYDRSGLRAIKARLERIDLSNFQPLSNAPVTRAKQRLQERSLSDEAQALLHLEDIGAECVLPDVVTVDSLFRELSSRKLAGNNISSARVTRAMLELRWVRLMENRQWVTQRNGERERYRFWARQNADHWRTKKAQEMYEHWIEVSNNPRQAEARDRGLYDADERPF